MILTSQLNLGSAEKLAVDLAMDLIKINQKVCLVSLQPLSEKNKLDKNAYSKENLIVETLNIRPKANIFKFLIALAKLRSILKRNNIDIVETSSPPLATLSAFAIIGTKTKQISGLHETFYKGKNRIKGGNTNSIRKRVFSFISRFNKNIYFYAVSNYVKKSWVEYSGTNPEKIKVVYDAIELPIGYKNKKYARTNLRNQLKVSHETKIAICVGRIVCYRKQDFLIDAFINKVSNQDLLLLIVGEADYSIPSTYAMVDRINKSLKNKKANNIKLIGYRKDIFNIMLGSDLLVHPTDMEGFGLTLVEAMYAGLPIVASRIEAIPEIVPEQDNILFAKDDKDELINSIFKVIEKPKYMQKQISKRNKLHASQFISKEKRSKKLLEFMKKIYLK